jgi:phosphoglycerate dehydrogenase-like enzyme
MVAAADAQPLVTSGDDGGVWEVFWCYPGWWDLAERLEALLPAWARLARVDASRPLGEQVGGARVLIPTTGVVDAATIAAASPNLRLIAQPAAGFDGIDVAAAAAAGVPVTLAPGCNAEAVAECALMLMLMLSRRCAEAAAAFAAGAPVGRPIGRELRGQALAIVGWGRTGRATAAAAAGLGMLVAGATTSTSSTAELHALLGRADVVSLHCPLTAATRGLIGAAEFAAMRPGALLINCARGAVVDRGALEAALEAGRLGGAGLDVHWSEPADASEALYRHPRVVSTPHLGSATAEVYERFARVLLANICAAHAGRPQDLLHRLC